MRIRLFHLFVYTSMNVTHRVSLDRAGSCERRRTATHSTRAEHVLLQRGLDSDIGVFGGGGGRVLGEL